MSLYLGTNLVSGVATPIEPTKNIGQIIQSTIPLSDAGLHLLDGALISGSGSYADFVAYMAGLVSNYPDCFCSEVDWQTSVTNYGVCGKFVYDSVNNTVRLPKITGFTEGTIDPTVLGDLTEAGLPNITGSTYLKEAHGRFIGLTNNNGCISGDDSGVLENANGGSDQGGNGLRQFKIDASLSSSIYGNSSTVQPQSIKVLYYIVIATSTKTSIEVDIDEIATDLNGKADTGLTNITNTAKVSIAHNAMPSDRYVDLTLGVSDTIYTAPADGWFTISKTAGSDWYTIYLQILDTTGTNVLLSQTIVGYRTTELKGSLPAKKGQKCKIWYNASGALQYFRFVYAQGAESEA